MTEVVIHGSRVIGKPARPNGRQPARWSPQPPIESLPDWHLDASCRGKDPNLFFAWADRVGEGDRRGGASIDARRRIEEQNTQAKRICGGCSVRAECLDWALKTRQPAGIFGGLTIRERRRERPPGSLRGASL